MHIEVVKSKIHRVKITQADLNYIGSITIDEDLMDASNIIKGTRGLGELCMNGPAARKVQTGDVVIIITYASMTLEEAKLFKPALIFPNEETNRLD
jgi:aspartate 1-decarboxylase